MFAYFLLTLSVTCKYKSLQGTVALETKLYEGLRQPNIAFQKTQRYIQYIRWVVFTSSLSGKIVKYKSEKIFY